MGIFWSRPQVQQPVIITQPGIPGQTVVYGAPYAYDSTAVGLALATDVIITDAIIDDVIIDPYYGGKKGKTLKKSKKTKVVKKLIKNR
jgi:hypothetical protein